MREDVLVELSRAPAQLNIMPDYPVDTVCGYIDVINEEGYPILEILGRPMDKALAILEELNARPQRSKVYMAIGTIITRSDAERVAALRPDLMVSPAFSRKVLEVAVQADIPYVPGISSLQDVQDVLDAFEDVGREVTVLKVCPVDLLGRDLVGVIGGIYPGIALCPTGTINMEDIPEWKAMPWMGAPMERWFVPDEMIHACDWDVIRSRLQEIKRLAAEGLSRRTE